MHKKKLNLPDNNNQKENGNTHTNKKEKPLRGCLTFALVHFKPSLMLRAH